MIPVTKAYLPEIETYFEKVKKIWTNQWLTNRGEMVLELEEKLKKHLSVSNMVIMNNGTIPLQIAMKLLGKGGEVITTPFSYVATTSVIVWENCTPVFVDIHPEYLTIDETKIEAAITDKTTAILATHVFGNPCEVSAIEAIAKKHNLSVIYDAAHCFGVNYKGQSVFEYGDISTCSFHATKIFHTAEGGALFCKDEKLFHESYFSHNFGHDGPLKFHGLGINAKISELQAAVGLSMLPDMPQIMAERKRVVDRYDAKIDYRKLSKFKIREHTDWNYSYYPVVFESEEQLLDIQQRLNSRDIFPRRYFYPSLNTIDYCRGAEMPISESVASRILCLPLYTELEDEKIDEIISIINDRL